MEILEQEPFGPESVARSAATFLKQVQLFDLLPSVVTALFSAHRGALYSWESITPALG
jgi:hypothetical protein